MIKINFDTEDASLSEDMELLNLTQTYFSNGQEWKYTSTKLRLFLDDTRYPYPAVSLQTFGNGIKFLNMIYNGKNPALKNDKSILATFQIHTRIFYERLHIYLTEKEQSLLNYANADYVPNISPSPFSFDIKKLKFSPSFSPLFIGLIGSLSKANNWKNLKENALNIAMVFYRDDYQASDIFYPSYQDNGEALYTYWLDILFPDELFKLILKYDRIIKELNDILQYDLKYGLYPLEKNFYNIIFKTRAGQRSFYHYMTNKLDEYRKSSDSSQINISDEWTNAQISVHNHEDDFYTANMSH